MPRAVITYHDDIEQGSDEWHQARADMYTGSNAHKLLNGIGDLEYAKAQESSFGGNFYTQRGHLLEEEAIDLYEKINDVDVRLTGYVTNSLFPGCLYSPDGMTTDTLLEVKSFNRDRHLRLIGIKSPLDIPITISAQIHYGMMITGLRRAHLVPYNPYFAKRKIENDAGELIDNPDYDPSKAIGFIPIRYEPAVANNFKRILLGVPA